MKRTILDFFHSKSPTANDNETKIAQRCKKMRSSAGHENYANTTPKTSTLKISQSDETCNSHNSQIEENLVPVSGSLGLYDIGLAMDRCLKNDEKLNFLNNTWNPDKTYVFSSQLEGKQNRKFKVEWINQFKWLAYSKLKAGAFCKICVLFAPSEAGVGSHQPLKTLVKDPLTRYKKALQVLHHHDKTNYHAFAVQKASNFNRVVNLETSSIAVQLDKQKETIIEANRKRLVPIVKTIIFCAHNNLPLRGHRDDGDLQFLNDSTKITGFNQGVFKNLLAFRIDAGDVDLKSHLETTKKNCTMISKTIQNEIIDTIAGVIRTVIVRNVKESKFYSILCDETTDVSTKEQMTFCIRYVDTNTYIIKEEFLGFVELTSTTGHSIKQAIYAELSKLDLSIENLRGQGYDGGSNMSGKFTGVQALIKSDQPLALYTHCFSHSLNLCISKSCEIPAIRNMMGILSSISIFLSASAKRVGIMERNINNLNNANDTRKTKLKALCNTRWIERHESVITFKQLFLPIVSTLEELENDQDGNTSSKAAMFSSSLKRSDFIICMEVTAYCLSHTLTLSKCLQSVEQDLSTALSYVNNIKSVFQNIRIKSETEFRLLYNQANNLASEIGATISMPRICKRQTERSNIGSSSTEEYYRINLFIPFMDHIIAQIESRFDGICNVIALEGLIPVYLHKYEDAQILEASAVYEIDMPGSVMELSSELKIWRQKWQGQQAIPKTALDALKECHHLFFPNLRTLLHIFIVLPVTTATAERSFSVLRRLKTYLRSTMGEVRLNGLALANINSSRELDISEIIATFCKKKPRRLEMPNWD